MTTVNDVVKEKSENKCKEKKNEWLAFKNISFYLFLEWVMKWKLKTLQISNGSVEYSYSTGKHQDSKVEKKRLFNDFIDEI